MNKYDRQIRLWSKSGQKALQEAHILVLGIRAATAETVKSLALSGLGHITLCDDRVVTQADLMANFFLQQEDLGSPIVNPCIFSLSELNPDIIIDKTETPNYSDYDVVCVSNGTTQLLEEIAQITDVIDVTNFGFFGKVRAFYQQYTSFETHPTSLVDLRFGENAWPELQAYVDSTVLDSLDEYAHQAVPFTTILGKLGAVVPSNMSEKSALKKLILDRAGPNDDNWREAASQMYRLWAPIVPKDTHDVLTKLEENFGSSEFWMLTAALRDFIKLYGVPPVSGVLPDMKTDTQNYTLVQGLYRKKAQQDIAKFVELLKQYSSSLPDDDTIRTFCKNSRYLLAIDGVSPASNTAAIEALTGDISDEFDIKRLYFRDVFLALELGCQAKKFWSPTKETVEMFTKQVKEPNVGILNEITRSGGGELNTIASIVGGIAAQEITKLILKHYTPIQHTLVYDGISSSAECF